MFASMMSRRAALAASFSAASVMRSAASSDQVTSHARPSGPCSICTIRSMAAKSTGVVSSAITTTSDGPANDDGTPTKPLDATSRLAWATRAPPGPTMTSTGRIVSVPKAIAADRLRAADPVYLVDAGQSAAAARMPSAMRPSGPGAEQSTTSGTPATRAGMAVIRTVEMRGVLAPGT